MAGADAGPNLELRDFTRRFIVGGLLTLPVGGAGDGRPSDRPASVSGPADRQLAAAPLRHARGALGGPLLERGWMSVRNRSLNMFTLIAMGIGVAWLYSLVATVAPGLFPAAFRGGDGAGLFRGGRRDHRAGAARPAAGAGRARARAARSGRSSTSRRAPLGASGRQNGRGEPSRGGPAGGCGRARRCRWTARSSRAAAPSTNRW